MESRIAIQMEVGWKERLSQAAEFYLQLVNRDTTRWIRNYWTTSKNGATIISEGSNRREDRYHRNHKHRKDSRIGVESTMIIKDGKQYRTIAEAARELGGVSAKTVREWIRKGIIGEPPVLEQGIRTIAYFPPEYIATAKEKLREYRVSKQSVRRLRV